MPKLPDNAKRPENQMKRRLAPGFWVDMNNQLHISTEELLIEFKLENTETNR